MLTALLQNIASILRLCFETATLSCYTDTLIAKQFEIRHANSRLELAPIKYKRVKVRHYEFDKLFRRGFYNLISII